MDIALSQDDLAFQDEVNAFIAEALPQTISDKVRNGLHLEKEEYVYWQKCLDERGWAGENWPVEYGGTGWSPTQKYLFQKACAEQGAPPVVAFGLKMVAPVIYTFGNDAQRERFLPDILASNVWWCQGYSEPGAGSDLAALKTRARRDGDHYVVNGTKIWTTMAQWADWIFCLVRTGEDSGVRQQGISFLLIDMRSPGISLSPIITIDGLHEVNEVHFDNVRVPAENLVGEEGRGWSYAKLLLTHERTGIAQIQQSKSQLGRLKSIAQRQPGVDAGRSLWDDPQFRARIGRVECDLLALEYTELRTLSAIQTGAAPGPESSILKICGTEIMQSIDALYMEVAGYGAFVHMPYDGLTMREVADDIRWCEAHMANRYFNNRKQSIFGGTNEIQKNIIAKQVLGLS